MTTHTVLYHKHCADGSAAALAAWFALGDTESRYIPCAYGQPLPDDIEAGSDVYMLDFTGKSAEILALALIAGRITIIDHHASAREALADLPQIARNTLGACEIRTIFDLDRSGCVLAWRHFHHDAKLPYLFRLVEDRDLWRFAFPESRALHYALDTDRDFRRLADGVHDIPTLHQWCRQGEAIETYIRRNIGVLINRAGPVLRWPAVHTPAGGAMPTRLLNCPPQWFSEVGEALLASSPDIEIATLYCDNERTHRRTWSLRSRKDGPDVSRIAAFFGGGGHPRAAGFHTDSDAFDLGLTPDYRAAVYSPARAPESTAA